MRPVRASRYTSSAAAGRSSTTSLIRICTAGRPRYVTAVAAPSTSAVEPSARRIRVASRTPAGPAVAALAAAFATSSRSSGWR